MKNVFLLIGLVALIGCGKGKQDNDIVPPGKIPNSKLTPTEKAEWEEFIVQTGRIVRSAVSSANTEAEVANDPLLQEMRALVGKHCTVSNPFGEPAPESADSKFTVSGTNCPIAISATRKSASKEVADWSIRMEILDQELAEKNLVQTIILKGTVTKKPSEIDPRKTDLNVHITGNIVSASGGSVRYEQIQRETNIVLNKKVVTITDRIFVFKPASRPRPIVLNHRRTPSKTTYNLQGEALNESEFRSYLSDLGFLLAGVPTDAG